MGGLTPTLGLGMGMSMIPQAKHAYLPGFATPHSMMQPQTPVNLQSCFLDYILIITKILATTTNYDISNDKHRWFQCFSTPT